VNDPDVLDIRGKVVATVDEGIQSDEAVVTLTMQDTDESESKIEKHVKHAIGSLADPMTNKQLKEKFVKQVSSILGAAGAEKLDGMAWNVLDLGDVAGIAEAGR